MPTMRPPIPSALLLLTVTLLAMDSLCPAQSSPAQRAENILFQQYDTIASMKSDLIPGSPKEIPAGDFRSSLRLSAIELYIAFANTSPDLIPDLKRNYPHLLLGAKDSNLFDPEPGDAFGAILPHEAFIAVSEATTQPNFEADFGKSPSETIDGRKVWTLAPISDRHPEWGRFYATQIDSRYFVVALGREDFLKIVRALTATAEPTRPGSINAWETFHPHEYWIYRTVRGSGDPAHNPIDGSGILSTLGALVFYANLDQPEGTLRVWSKDRSVSTAPKLATFHNYFALRAAGQGTWQTEVPFKPDDNNRDVFFVLFGMLGFSVAP